MSSQNYGAIKKDLFRENEKDKLKLLHVRSTLSSFKKISLEIEIFISKRYLFTVNLVLLNSKRYYA